MWIPEDGLGMVCRLPTLIVGSFNLTELEKFGGFAVMIQPDYP
jgi:hypothetical protein